MDGYDQLSNVIVTIYMSYAITFPMHQGRLKSMAPMGSSNYEKRPWFVTCSHPTNSDLFPKPVPL
jgi:hypothetical protein